MISSEDLDNLKGLLRDLEEKAINVGKYLVLINARIDRDRAIANTSQSIELIRTALSQSLGERAELATTLSMIVDAVVSLGVETIRVLEKGDEISGDAVSNMVRGGSKG